MSNGRTYDDPVKAVAREKIRQFIAGHYSDRKLRDLRVLCFPGAEVEGEEALEVRQVYDKLGIPRKNIVGLEYDRKCAERLSKANLGIEVVCAEDWRYLQDTEKTFDVVSLDYTSNFGDAQRYVLDLIAARSLLANRGILATNYYGARERGRTQETIKGCAARSKGITLYDLINDFDGTMKKINNTIDNTDLSDTRSRGLQVYLSGSMVAGVSALNPYIFKKIFDSKFFSNLLEGCREFVEKEYGDGEISGRSLDERVARTTAFRTGALAGFLKSISLSVKDERIMTHLWFSLTKPYVAKAHESYSYVSNKGSPMFMDLWLFEKYYVRDDFFKISLPYVYVLPNYSGRKRAELKEKAIKSAESSMELRAKLTVIERQFLGSSYVPRPKNEKGIDSREEISKEEAIELLASGIPAKEIAEAFSGFSVGQLAAFKAHITMGTYRGSNEEERNKRN